MQMIPGRPSALSYSRNTFTLADPLPNLHQVRMIMRIDRDRICLMLQDDHPAIPPWPPVTKKHLTIRSRVDRCASRCSNVQAIMAMGAMASKPT